MNLNPFPSIKRGVLAVIASLVSEDGRKGWAMLAALGCSFIMTGYAGAVLWLVRNNPAYAFSLGLAAMGIIVIVITGLMWLLGVRRDTEINLKDGTVKTTDAAVAQAAAKPLEAAPTIPTENSNV